MGHEVAVWTLLVVAHLVLCVEARRQTLGLPHTSTRYSTGVMKSPWPCRVLDRVLCRQAHGTYP